MADVLCAGAVLLVVAPLLVVILVAARARSLERFLHVSGLADLPALIDVVRGRASLVAGQPMVTPAAADLAPVMPAAPLFATREQAIIAYSELEIVGCNFRDSFVAAVSSEFDGLLGAIDRAFGAKGFTASPA